MNDWLILHITKKAAAYHTGYVRVTKGHPWWGKDTWQLNASSQACRQVHGMVTYASGLAPHLNSGDPTGWWVGFDTDHSSDREDTKTYPYALSQVLDLAWGAIKEGE